MGLHYIYQSENNEQSEYDDNTLAYDDNSQDDQDDDSDDEALGTITLIMGNRENEHPNLIDAYFNGIRSETESLRLRIESHITFHIDTM